MEIKQDVLIKCNLAGYFMLHFNTQFMYTFDVHCPHKKYNSSGRNVAASMNSNGSLQSTKMNHRAKSA